MTTVTTRAKRLLNLALCQDTEKRMDSSIRNDNDGGTKRINVISEHILSPPIASAKTPKYSSFTNGIRASNTSTTLDLPTEPTEDKVTKFLDSLPECNIYDFVNDDNEPKTYTTLRPVDLLHGKQKESKSINIISEHILSTPVPSAEAQKYSSFTNGIRASDTILDLPTEPTENIVTNFLSSLPESNINDCVKDDNEAKTYTRPVDLLHEKQKQENQVANSDDLDHSLDDSTNSDSDSTFVVSESDYEETNSTTSDKSAVYDKQLIKVKENMHTRDIEIPSNFIRAEKVLDNLDKYKYNDNNTQVVLNESMGTNLRIAISRRKSKIWDKRDLCPFCFIEITHFARHMERKHKEEPKVKKIMSISKGSKERKYMWDCLRKEGNFYSFREEKRVVAVRRPPENQTKNAKNFDDFAVCEFCMGVYKKKTLYRHANSCPGRVTENQKNGRLYALTNSQTFLAATRCHNDFLLKSRLKKEVLNIMRPDEISAVAKNDILICVYGETHLKKHKREQIVTVTSNKMRELSRLLIALRKITPVKNLIDAMKPEYFDDIIAATKVISGFNVADKTFKASSLALHMGTSLKQLCDIVDRHILKKSPLFSFQNPEQERKDIKSLRKLIETSWANEIASLALKDITEKHWEKPQIIPVTSDIIKFNNYVKSEVEKAAVGLTNMIREGKEDDTKELILLYKKLAKGIMALVLVLNRKRIGEIQYLKMSTYFKSFSDPNNQEEILKSLSASERVVCKNFRRIVSGGKGSKPVPILFSPYIQQKINFMLDIRKKINEIPKSNDYIFANPHSSKGWFHGTSVIRSFAVSCKASNPSSLTSTKFRKQTATILQVMNLSENDMEQLALFMGHTKKTHEEWYRLPQDVYQVAKIAKLLLMIDKGEAYKYQGKGLEDIVIKETDCLEIEEADAERSKVPSSDVQNSDKSESEEEYIVKRKRRQSTENVSENEEDGNEAQMKKIKKRPVSSRQKWGERQKAIMCKYFKKFINNKKVPKKKRCRRI